MKSLVSEIITVDEHADSDALIRSGRIRMERPVLGSVYLRTGEDLSGPWKVIRDEERGTLRTAQIRAPQGQRVWRWKWEEFTGRARVIHRDVNIVVDWHWDEYTSESYTLVFQSELKSAFEHADVCDSLSDRDVLRKVAQATATQAERREVERFFETGLAASESIDELRDLRPRMERIARSLRDYDDELEPMLRVLLDREELKPGLERAQEERASEYVRERRDALEMQARRELAELVSQRNTLQEEIQKAKEAHDDALRRQQADLQEERERHLAELEDKQRDFKRRQEESLSTLETASKRLLERRSEVLEDFLGMLPLLKEVGVVPASGTVAVAGQAPVTAPRLRTFELPPFVLSGTPEKPAKEREFLDRWVQHCRDSGYSYADSDLLNYHVAMKSERFSIITGPSGVGKSALPRLYSQALDGAKGDIEKPDRYLMIATRPGWMDTRDLLGHVNSLDAVFVPSPTQLFEYLVYASEEESRGHPGIYVVNLDEMNLSYAEHYFSDVLSALQSPEGQQGIRCFYPDAVREEDPLRKYGFLTIARNVRFVGTASIDETTKPFSPRLLDRVNVVEIQGPTHMGFGAVDGETIGQTFLVAEEIEPISASVYRNWSVYRPGDEVRAVVQQALEPIQKTLTQYGYPVSPRVLSSMMRYVANAQDILSEQEALDRQVFQRVLSKFRGHTERFRHMLQELLTHLPEEQYPRSYRRLERMVESEYAMDFFQCQQA